MRESVRLSTMRWTVLTKTLPGEFREAILKYERPSLTELVCNFARSTTWEKHIFETRLRRRSIRLAA